MSIRLLKSKSDCGVSSPNSRGEIGRGYPECFRWRRRVAHEVSLWLLHLVFNLINVTKMERKEFYNEIKKLILQVEILLDEYIEFDNWDEDRVVKIDKEKLQYVFYILKDII